MEWSSFGVGLCGAGGRTLKKPPEGGKMIWPSHERVMCVVLGLGKTRLNPYNLDGSVREFLLLGNLSVAFNQPLYI